MLTRWNFNSCLSPDVTLHTGLILGNGDDFCSFCLAFLCSRYDIIEELRIERFMSSRSQSAEFQAPFKRQYPAELQ